MTSVRNCVPRVTVSYEAGSYAPDEMVALASRLEPCAEVGMDPVFMPHSTGMCELWATIAFREPSMVGGALVSDVHDALAAVCAELGDWCRATAAERVDEPEVVAVHLEFADLRLAFDSESEPGGYLCRPEIRAIPSLLRDMAPRLALLVSSSGDTSVCAGIRAHRNEAGVVRSSLARYWQLGRVGQDPDLIYDSWRDWVYRRSGGTGTR